jgi:hypothetical protein
MKKFEEYFKERPEKLRSLVGNRTVTLESLYASVVKLDLLECVPKDVRELWEVAQDLYVHSYYSYNFVPVSDLYCSLSLELAIRKRVGDKVGFLPNNLGHAIQRIRDLFPKIKPLQEKWFEVQNTGRGIRAHPVNRALDYWKPHTLRGLGIFINGLYCEDEPRLLIPEGFLFDSRQLGDGFLDAKKKWATYFLYPHYPCIPASGARKFILGCDRYELGIARIFGYKESEDGLSPVLDLCKDVDLGEEPIWKEFTNRAYKDILKVVEGQADKPELYFYFDLIHRETWHKYRLIRTIPGLKGYADIY